MPGECLNQRSAESRDLPVVVLKFGGSVLRNEADIARVVHEVYRWVRRGKRVVAVVSALEGTTDALIAQARAYADSPDSLHAGAYASLLATGEQTSAALLGLALDRAGLPVEILDAASVSLLTSGTVVDGFPESIDAPRILSTLNRVPVVVLPGFIGRDTEGRTTLLGRGGSDLTALFVAERLIAAGASKTTCRLVKDVDGLYEFDPANGTDGERPRRFTHLHWDGALALDGGIVQHKAVRYAKEKGLSFEVGAALEDRATLVADTNESLDPAPTRDRTPRTRVVLLGCGTVGLGVYKRLIALPDLFDVVAVAVRDIAKAIASGVEPHLLTTDPLGAAELDCDLIIETIGGTEIARHAIERALRAGKDVVTANKAVIATHGDELRAIAASTGTTLRYSAAVGGATPALEALAHAAELGEILEITGVLNGTTNFVLGRVGEGESFSDAVRRAQAAGFAEQDPSRDLDGRDAGDKLCVLAQEAWDITLDPSTIEREPLSQETIDQSIKRLDAGHVIRHVATVAKARDGTIRATVRIRHVDATEPLGRVQREWNAVTVRIATGEAYTVYGRGAGRWPTAESVLADVLEHVASSRSPALATP
ncbi:MAG: homoserine dehydrogenase [Phycisphaeraceae bacterium]|nr:MAG: homoserine dehydrogenase [Phycisphaeraceae bacterium]